jgi:hypothetical protein
VCGSGFTPPRAAWQLRRWCGSRPRCRQLISADAFSAIATIGIDARLSASARQEHSPARVTLQYRSLNARTVNPLATAGNVSDRPSEAKQDRTSTAPHSLLYGRHLVSADVSYLYFWFSQMMLSHHDTCASMLGCLAIDDRSCQLPLVPFLVLDFSRALNANLQRNRLHDSTPCGTA